jgi:hypothetical protein
VFTPTIDATQLLSWGEKFAARSLFYYFECNFKLLRAKQIVSSHLRVRKIASDSGTVWLSLSTIALSFCEFMRMRINFMPKTLLVYVLMRGQFSIC